ncbi:calcium/proton exchanger [Fimbriimonas ginsengisoli]|uniref:Ca(2+)/H(+) antiporter n=1 Tax=Fimbriimonas ginsengisoli Gsoil 348 TaxID=661478 RepID=A0A068NJ37_FIMGI|nr:calcium/proton exchanger [Fimbriimonas ginsengisoli]AIE83598.1 calcium/proton exchanger [Fimbriimonas ginsengisoli Gsoil 348]
MFVNLLLLFIPISVVLAYVVHAPAVWIFATGVLAIVPIAEWIRKATEHVAHRAGSTIGGLLNVTFGNVSELVIALFVLAEGNQFVVKGQITGSIIGNGLLGLGLGLLAGGIGRERQKFKQDRAGMMSSLLLLSVIGLILPAVFDYTERSSFGNRYPRHVDELLSLGVAIVLLLVYIANLVYTFVTHKSVFASPPETEDCEKHAWPLSKAIGVLIVGTAFIALEAELVSHALEETARQLHLSTFFLGVTVLAIVGNASEYISAVYFARKDRIGLVLSITVGSSIQMALLIAPLLVIASFIMRKPMTLVFATPLELVAITAVAFIVNSIAQDGETNWFEGVLLLAVYCILAIAFYFVVPM